MVKVVEIRTGHKAQDLPAPQAQALAKQRMDEGFFVFADGQVVQRAKAIKSAITDKTREVMIVPKVAGG